MNPSDLLFNLVKINNPITCIQAAKELNLPHQTVISTLKSLESREILQSKVISKQNIELSELGKDSVLNKTPEYRLYEEVLEPKIKSLCKFAEFSSGALRRKLIKVDSSIDKKDPILSQSDLIPVDEIQVQLQNYKNLSQKEILLLKKSKFLVENTVKFFEIELGPKQNEFDIVYESELTQAHLSQKAETLHFKPLNFNAKGKPVSAGSLHPLMKFRSLFVDVLTSMGFKQMQTDNYLESSFWNFDALFQPQQHPARDMHDTFFVGGEFENFELKNLNQQYYEAVKSVHEKGYKYIFDDQETSKNLLRTHTTAVSARRLYKLAQDYKSGNFKPLKSFSIDRVFRNETLDATHLCEFHQVEGFICDENVSLRDLMGTIKAFFKELGMENVRFKPTYNPYTEPSMEIFCYHEGLSKWIEVGNSGMFRPEMLRTMGFGPEIQCIAWGLSLERPTMIKYGINNIRDLIGPACDLDMICNCVDPTIE